MVVESCGRESRVSKGQRYSASERASLTRVGVVVGVVGVDEALDNLLGDFYGGLITVRVVLGCSRLESASISSSALATNSLGGSMMLSVLVSPWSRMSSA